MNPFHRRSILPLLVSSLLFVGCADESGSGGEDPSVTQTARRTIQVETLVLQPATFEDVIELTGTVDAPNDAMLSAQASGTVTSLARLGQTVQKNQVVAQLDQGLAKAALDQAQALAAVSEAQNKLAEETYERQEPLYRDSIISALEFENVSAQLNQSKAQLSQARAAVLQAEEQMKNTRVRTPFSGTVEERFVDVGEQVSPGTPVARIVNTEVVKVKAGVPERYAGDIHTGTSVEIAFKAYAVPPRSGKVTFVGRVINPSNRTFTIEVELDNADGLLKPEMIASLFITRNQYAESIVVPQTAVIRDENGVSMYVVTATEDGPVAERRPVLLGASYGGKVVVQRGLDAGDEVIIVGQTKVTDGDAVEVALQSNSLAL